MAKKRSIPWGEWFIPIIALLYAAFTLTDQIIRGLPKSTVMYSAFLIAIIIIFAVTSILKTWVDRAEVDMSDECRARRRQVAKRIIFFLIWSAMFMPGVLYLGYIITIFIYLGVLLWALGLRPWGKVLALDCGFVIFVHFVFVKLLDMPLEPGILKGLM